MASPPWRRGIPGTRPISGLRRSGNSAQTVVNPDSLAPVLQPDQRTGRARPEYWEYRSSEVGRPGNSAQTDSGPGPVDTKRHQMSNLRCGPSTTQPWFALRPDQRDRPRAPGTPTFRARKTRKLGSDSHEPQLARPGSPARPPGVSGPARGFAGTSSTGATRATCSSHMSQPARYV